MDLVILVLLTEEFVYCIPPSLSLGVLQFEQSGGFLTEESKLKVRWPSYFEWLYQTNTPAVELDVRGVALPIADPPISCEPPSFVETLAVVYQLKGGKPQ